ncbi:tigger transposable element-derived protein 1-like [Macrobrachium rosenbergii]|uniref:tigger transposable element-derived protein 1-like n=1 Tax=Macrobrachium rosenbergii TaxID=79674 RepID=UPI0034D3F31D
MANGKCKASENSGSCKNQQAISMETKVAIIKKLESGEKMVEVARHYNMYRSTIGTIFKNKDRIMEHMKSEVPVQSTIISKRRGKLVEEMEKLLGTWMEHQRQRSVPLSLMLIQEKAKIIFDDLKAKAGKSAADETFTASHGWFHISKKALTCITCPSAQVFNIDETGLFWKKMAEKTHISCEKKTMPGFKVAEDEAKFTTGWQCIRRLEVKLLSVYRAANPQKAP